jgi:hypothetical protein
VKGSRKLNKELSESGLKVDSKGNVKFVDMELLREAYIKDQAKQDRIAKYCKLTARDMYRCLEAQRIIEEYENSMALENSFVVAR